MCFPQGAVAQMVERSLSMREAAGSIPASSIFMLAKELIENVLKSNSHGIDGLGSKTWHALIAQLVRAFG